MRETLLRLVNENFVLPIGKSQIETDTKLFKTGIIDSFSLLDLLLIIENDLGITLELSEIIGEGIETIDELVAYIKVRQNE